MHISILKESYPPGDFSETIVNKFREVHTLPKKVTAKELLLTST